MPSNTSLVGFFNPKEQPGPITGSGPGFASAMHKHKKRLAKEKEVGTWRTSPAGWKVNKGKKIDPDYYIVRY